MRCSVKNNIAADVFGLAYRIEPSDTPGIGMVAWERDPVELSADEALAHDGSHRDNRAEVQDFLRDLLANGRLPAKEILDAGCANGFTEKAMRRAYRALGGRPHREGFGKIW